eukprot:SAG11_NODE_3744_length_2254_cov_1.617633_1_plen_104_part_00
MSAEVGEGTGNGGSPVQDMVVAEPVEGVASTAIDMAETLVNDKRLPEMWAALAAKLPETSEEDTGLSTLRAFNRERCETSMRDFPAAVPAIYVKCPFCRQFGV